MVGKIVSTILRMAASLCLASRHRGLPPGDAAPASLAPPAAGATTVVLRELRDRLPRDRVTMHGMATMAEPAKRWTPDAWDNGTERYELVDGHVLAMAPPCSRCTAS